MMLSRIFFLGLLLLSTRLLAADMPNVLIETVVLKQQLMKEVVSGYGVVSPDTRSLQNINLPRSGQLISLLVSAGQIVKKGAPLLEFSTSADAALSYHQATQAVDFAKGEMKRIEQLVGQQMATQSQLAIVKKALADAEASLHSQEKIGAGLAMDQVVAPFDGVVVAVQAAQGDRLAAGTSVLQLARVSGQRVLLGIEPENLKRIQPGMMVNINPVFRSELKIIGRVTQVFGMINQLTQLVDVLVEVPSGGIMPGMRVRAEVEVNKKMMWVVPRSAVLHDANSAYLFQVVRDKARRINVQIELEQDGLIAMQGAFDPKLPVVSLGNYELYEGMAVRGGTR